LAREKYGFFSLGSGKISTIFPTELAQKVRILGPESGNLSKKLCKPLKTETESPAVAGLLWA
jgi:hypothetical protein